MNSSTRVEQVYNLEGICYKINSQILPFPLQLLGLQQQHIVEIITVVSHTGSAIDVEPINQLHRVLEWITSNKHLPFTTIQWNEVELDQI